MNSFLWPLESLLDLIYPERCSLCGAEHGEAPWFPRGRRVPGIRRWDGTHLCLECSMSLEVGCVTGLVGDGQSDRLPAAAAASTNPALVALIGGFKYHGQRGLAWPLAEMMRVPLAAALEQWGAVDAVVPVALHPRRRRRRGFNQAEILARLLAMGTSIRVLTHILARHRHSGQQAKLTSRRERRSNVADCFGSRPPSFGGGILPGRANRVGLLDDLVTSGWTAASAAESLKAAGWEVRWVIAAGLVSGSKNPSRRVDTLEGGF